MPPTTSSSRRLLIALALPICLIGLASCGSDEAKGDTGTEGSTPDPEAVAAGMTITVSSTDLGDVLVDGEGNTLYLFTPDGTGDPTCVDECATTWPPLISKGEPEVDGVDDGVVDTVSTADGSLQVTAGGHPLYIYSGDSAPGETKGQGSDDKWYVVGPTGEAITTEAK